MIKKIIRKRIKGGHFWYKYNDNDYKLHDLVIVSKTKLHKNVVSTRLTNHFNGVCVFNSLEDLLEKTCEFEVSNIRRNMINEVQSNDFNKMMKLF